MRSLREYATTLRGVVAYAIDAWEESKKLRQQHYEDEYSRAFFAGKMIAYSEIIELGTGRRIGVEPELVKVVAETI